MPSRPRTSSSLKPVPFLSNVLIVLFTILLILATHTRIAAMHDWHLYDSMDCMQLTIFTIHLTPIIALKCLIPIFLVTPKDKTVWALILPALAIGVANRVTPGSPVSPYNLVLTSLELIVAVRPIDRATLRDKYVPVFMAANGLVVVGFWTGILAASCSETFTFMPLDREIRTSASSGSWLGHFHANPAAMDLLLREVIGHAAMQLLALLLLAVLHPAMQSAPGRLFAFPELNRQVLAGLVLYLGAYAAVTVASSVAFSADFKLPYNLSEFFT